MAVIAIYLRIATRALRWQILFPSPRPAYGPLLLALIIGQTINYVTPSWAGDLTRVYLIGSEKQQRVGRTLGTVFLDKLCDLLLFLLFAAALLMISPFPQWLILPLRTLALMTGAGMVFLLIAVVNRPLVLKSVAWLESRLPGRWRGRLVNQMGSILDGLEGLHHPAIAVQAGVWSLVLWLWDAAAHLFVLWAVGVKGPWVAPLLLSTVLRVGFAIPAMPGQIGVYEGIVTGVLALFGVEAELAFGVGILRHVVDFFPPLLVALGLNFFLEKGFVTPNER